MRRAGRQAGASIGWKDFLVRQKLIAEVARKPPPTRYTSTWLDTFRWTIGSSVGEDTDVAIRKTGAIQSRPVNSESVVTDVKHVPSI
jgi:hypothetical protein